MKVVACYSLKGGVGKTSAAVNLAFAAARPDCPVLLWDLDPQGGASFYYRVRPRLRGGAKRLVLGTDDLDRHIRGSDFPDLDVLPADVSLRKMDLWLGDAKKPRHRLVRLLQQLDGRYGVVILDCPPALSLGTEAVFTIADQLAIPVIPNQLAIRALGPVADHLATRARKVRSVPIASPFFSMSDRRKSIHRHYRAAPPKKPFRFLRTVVPLSSIVERMELERAPVTATAPGSAVSMAYRNLWRELAAKMKHT